jgi:y4mF family transcriptional regulator
MTVDLQGHAARLGDAIRRRRRKLGLRQQQLADLAEVSVRFVHEIEHGKPTVQLAQVLLVLDALGLRISIAPGRGPLIVTHE